MASEPAAWMDEFRPKLRWFATVKLLSSRRLERAGHNDPDEPDRIEAEWFAAHGSAQTQFCKRPRFPGSSAQADRRQSA